MILAFSSITTSITTFFSILNFASASRFDKISSNWNQVFNIGAAGATCGCLSTFLAFVIAGLAILYWHSTRVKEVVSTPENHVTEVTFTLELIRTTHLNDIGNSVIKLDDECLKVIHPDQVLKKESRKAVVQTPVLEKDGLGFSRVVIIVVDLVNFI